MRVRSGAPDGSVPPSLWSKESSSGQMVNTMGGVIPTPLANAIKIPNTSNQLHSDSQHSAFVKTDGISGVSAGEIGGGAVERNQVQIGWVRCLSICLFLAHIPKALPMVTSVPPSGSHSQALALSSPSFQ